MNRGPLQTYEIIWRSGHSERIQAHQVSWDAVGFGVAQDAPRRVVLHADDPWRLVLSADEADIRTIRNVTVDEMLPSNEV